MNYHFSILKLKQCNSISNILKVKSLKIFCLKITYIFLCIFICLDNAQALTKKGVIEDKSIIFQEKLSKQFTKKFCNSIGFGISKESALKFSAGEIKKEMSRKILPQEINQEDLELNIASNVVNSCGLPLGFSGEKGISDFKSFLFNSNDLEYLKINK
tara:strand:+ start:481 stop:954 length:474 start_codon:yes stop_codon:yes gene_type:complete